MPDRPLRTPIIPLIVACALFMENLDSTVLSTALPAIARSLDENPLRLNLAISSYLLSLAVFIPVSGWLADRVGAKMIFRIAIGVFTLGSICCGLSDSLLMLVAARVFQGMGGAMMVPVGRLVLLRSTEKSDLVRAMSYLTVPALIGPIIGPPVGGFLVTYFSWRWIFWINVPIGILGILLVTKFIEDIRADRPQRFDFRGFALTAVGISAAMFGFELAGRGLVPTSWVVVLLTLGVCCLTLYVLHARRAAAPIIELRLLRVPTFRAGILGGFMFRVGAGAIPFLLPMMLQLGFGLSAFHSGALTFASGIGAMTMKLTARPILRWIGFRPVLIGNALICGGFLGAIGLLQAGMPHLGVILFLLVSGFFRSLQFTSINTLTVADIDRPALSQASTFSATAQQLSLSVGVGVGALALHLTMQAGGGPITAADFMFPFFAVGLLTAGSALLYIGLPRHAGAEVSGHRLPVAAASE
jgi:EmrB/QacA subfamily drug resistance transporter